MASSPFRQNGAFGDGKWILWSLGLVPIAILSFRIPELMTGWLAGRDDMMRRQQVRDVLAGHSWFDVDQARLLTPEGGNMHWSRLPDLFLAGFILVMQPLIGQAAAEALAIAVWPLMLFAAVITLLCLIMQRLGISRAGQVCALFFFFGSAALFNFWPGRIDHHGLVAVLIMAGLAALLSREFSARSGIIAALCVCAALTIAIEALPYVVGLIALLGLFWVVRGHLEGVRLASFGLALIVSASLFLALDAPGLGDRRMVCDAYGTSHWAALASGGVLLTLLGVFGGWLASWPKRLVAGAVAAASFGLIYLPVALGIVVMAYVLTQIVPLNELYSLIEWPVVVLLGSMIPLGAALEDVGGTELIANGLLSLTEGLPAWAILTLLMIVTMTLSDVLNNTATTIVAAPVGIQMANSLGVSPDPFLMAVAVAASAAFLTPIGHKNNTLIMGPGGYRFGDYWRRGRPLEIVVIAVAVPVILMVWPL